MNNKVAKIVTIAALVIAIGGASEAARHYRHHAPIYAKDTARCDTNKDFYAEHSRWCDGAEREHLVTIHHRVRHDFPPVQTFEQVTVRRDPQANTEVGKPDQFIALQTQEDVARSSAYGSTTSIWSPGALALGTQHLISKLAYAVTPQRAPVRTVATVAKPTRLTTGGAVTITIAPAVTVAQK